MMRLFLVAVTIQEEKEITGAVCNPKAPLAKSNKYSTEIFDTIKSILSTPL